LGGFICGEILRLHGILVQNVKTFPSESLQWAASITVKGGEKKGSAESSLPSLAFVSVDLNQNALANKPVV